MKTPFRFDGHGINDAEGQRLVRVSLEPHNHDSGKPVRNTEFDKLSNLFCAAPELLEALREYVATMDGFVDSPLVQKSRAAIAKAEGRAE